MRVLYICKDRGVPVFGHKGCSLHVQEILRALLDLGHHCTLLAARHGGHAPRDLTSLSVLPALDVISGTDAQREQAELESNQTLHRRTATLLAQTDVVYERYALWSYGALEAASEAGVPAVLEVNAPLLDEQARYRALHDADAALDATRRAFRAASQIIAVSEEVASWVSQFDEAGDKVTVVPNGVNTRRFSAIPRLRESRHHPVTFGFVGTLKPWHGTALALEAFAALNSQLPLARLLIIGDGPESASLRAQALELGIDANVTFTGAVAPEAMPTWLTHVDIGLAPYPALDDFYFSPLKIYEYMAAGMPVIASQTGQIANIVEHGETGLLVPPGDIEALASAMLTLARLPDRGALYGLAGLRRVQQAHDWRHVAQRTLNLLPQRRHNEACVS